jgi:hypothetical protein
VTTARARPASNTQWRSDIQTERALAQKVQVLRTALKGIVTARFGAGAAAILQFGFALPKARTRSAETKAVAAVKSLATREARGTKGSVQKKSVKGNVTVQLVVSSPSQPAAGTSGASSGGASAAGVGTAVTSAAAAATPASAAAAAPASPAPTSAPSVNATNGAAH